MSTRVTKLTPGPILEHPDQNELTNFLTKLLEKFDSKLVPPGIESGPPHPAPAPMVQTIGRPRSSWMMKIESLMARSDSSLYIFRIKYWKSEVRIPYVLVMTLGSRY